MNDLDKNEIEQNLRITTLEEHVVSLSNIIGVLEQALESQLKYNEVVKETISLLAKVIK